MLAQFRWAGDSNQPLAPGKHTIVFDFKYDGPGIAKGGTGVLSVDGQMIRTLSDAENDPVPTAGRRDLRRRSRHPYSSVNEQDYQVPFRFNGKIEKLTINLGKEQLTAEEQRRIDQAVAIAHD